MLMLLRSFATNLFIPSLKKQNKKQIKSRDELRTESVDVTTGTT